MWSLLWCLMFFKDYALEKDIFILFYIFYLCLYIVDSLSYIMLYFICHGSLQEATSYLLKLFPVKNKLGQSYLPPSTVCICIVLTFRVGCFRFGNWAGVCQLSTIYRHSHNGVMYEEPAPSFNVTRSVMNFNSYY